jgi:DNA repair ATPase RecN
MMRVRQKIQAAREVVAGLPDIDKSVEEQEEEIRRVEARIERLRVVSREVGEEARRLVEEKDTARGAMEGVQRGGEGGADVKMEG